MTFSTNFYISFPMKFKDLWSKYFGLVTKHKDLEMQLMKDGTLIGYEIDISWKGYSHAGPRFSIALLFHRFEIILSDSRHWNYEHERWNTPEETKAELARYAEWEKKNDKPA